MRNADLPYIARVREVLTGRCEFVLIAPDPAAGRPHVYSVIHIRSRSGMATCIGRELPLKDARQVARHALASSRLR